MEAGGNAAQAEFTTAPSPPHEGPDVVRVTLTAKGTPIAGAVVTVTFFMPAMPAMGMAAKRTALTLSGQGSGRYEGQVTLESAGTWQVNILAQKDGRTIAARQTSVNAEGGM
jgi:Cu(I)/Ag(I) efflux system membrane fusion protein/cobalt-zinc-cadmium efflux system membrane fusion protein